MTGERTRGRVGEEEGKDEKRKYRRGKSDNSGEGREKIDEEEKG
jgi:hypothetical protein